MGTFSYFSRRDLIGITVIRTDEARKWPLNSPFNKTI